jgi:uncharacterized membrane protein YkvA (DUF1232 family)
MQESKPVIRFQRGALTVRFELHLMGRAGFNLRFCYLSKLALALGIGFLLGPWDPIPNRIPVFGYFDQAGFVVIAVACARLLIPNDVVDQVAARYGLVVDHTQTSWLALALLRCQSALLSADWIMRRRLSRMILRFTSKGGDERVAARSPDVFAWLGYRWWWRLRSILGTRQPEARGMFVLGGSERSGTTLLRTMLGRHPWIASGPETSVFLKRISSSEHLGQQTGWDPAMIEAWQRESRSQAEFIARFQAHALDSSGKMIWTEKTPANVKRFGFVTHPSDARVQVV